MTPAEVALSEPSRYPQAALDALDEVVEGLALPGPQEAMRALTARVTQRMAELLAAAVSGDLSQRPALDSGMVFLRAIVAYFDAASAASEGFALVDALRTTQLCRRARACCELVLRDFVAAAVDWRSLENVLPSQRIRLTSAALAAAQALMQGDVVALDEIERTLQRGVAL